MRSHGSRASSRMSWSVLGATPSSCRCSEARLRAAAKSERTRVVSGTRPTDVGRRPFPVHRLWARCRLLALGGLLCFCFAGKHELLPRPSGPRSLPVSILPSVIGVPSYSSSICALPSSLRCFLRQSARDRAGIRQDLAEQGLHFVGRLACRGRPAARRQLPGRGRRRKSALRSGRFWPAAIPGPPLRPSCPGSAGSVLPTMLSTIMRPGLSAADVLGLPQNVGGLGQRPHFQHARLARHQCQVASQQQGPAGFGVAAGSVGDDVIRLLGEGRQPVEDFVGVSESNGLDVRARLLSPIRRRNAACRNRRA